MAAANRFVFVWSLALLRLSSARPDGAPLEACQDMVPRHGPHQPRTDPCPFVTHPQQVLLNRVIFYEKQTFLSIELFLLLNTIPFLASRSNEWTPCGAVQIVVVTFLVEFSILCRFFLSHSPSIPVRNRFGQLAESNASSFRPRRSLRR